MSQHTENNEETKGPIEEVEAQLDPRQPRPKGLKRYIPVLVVGLGFMVFFVGGFQNLLSFDTLADNRAELLAWTDENRVLAILAFMVAYVVVVSLSLPGGVWLTLAGGFIFGGLEAAAYVLVGATVGATLIFLGARYAFADLCHAKAGTSLAKMEDGFRENAFSYLLFLRLVPLFPFWLVNLVPALLDVRLSTYVIATFIGIVPGTVVFAHAGEGLGVALETGARTDPGAILMQPQVIWPLLALAALSLLPVAYKKLKGKSA